VSEGTPASIPVQTAFFVVVDEAGAISVHTSEIPAVTMSREASLYDIETYASQLVRNVSRILTANTVKQILLPVEPSVSSRVAEALKKREED
jgi:hypothetical protein